MTSVLHQLEHCYWLWDFAHEDMTEARMPGQPEVRDGKQQQLARTLRLQAKTTSCRAWKPVLTTEPESR